MIAEGVFAGSWECGWLAKLRAAVHSRDPERASTFRRSVALDVTEDGAWTLTVHDPAVIEDLRAMGVPL